jgi:16S rRNA (uracil1498-N3)-methyltransferase
VFVADLSAPVVDPDDRHHLVRVLRLRPGELVVASDGRGRWCPCRFRGHLGPTGERDELLEVDGPVVSDPALTPALVIAFTPAKGSRPEWVVQKLTELGVDRIVPLLTVRSVVRWEGERAVRSVERLRKVAREAAAQSRRVWLPEVASVHTLPALAAAAGAGPTGPGGAISLAQLGGARPTAASTVVAVGPEGGWAPMETDLGFATVGLGPYVLRAETAAVAAGAILGALRAGTVGGDMVGSRGAEVGGSR